MGMRILSKNLLHAAHCRKEAQSLHYWFNHEIQSSKQITTYHFLQVRAGIPNTKLNLIWLFPSSVIKNSIKGILLNPEEKFWEWWKSPTEISPSNREAVLWPSVTTTDTAQDEFKAAVWRPQNPAGPQSGSRLFRNAIKCQLWKNDLPLIMQNNSNVTHRNLVNVRSWIST